MTNHLFFHYPKKELKSLCENIVATEAVQFFKQLKIPLLRIHHSFPTSRDRLFTIHHSLKASTIVEVVTAALLVLISLGIGMMIFANVLTSEGLVAKTKAQTVLTKIAEDTEYQQVFITEQIELPGMIVQKEITPFLPEYPNAILLTLTAFNADKSRQLCELKQVIYATAAR